MKMPMQLQKYFQHIKMEKKSQDRGPCSPGQPPHVFSVVRSVHGHPEMITTKVPLGSESAKH